jgi:hypothetical protein
MPYLLLSLAACFWGGNYVVGHILVAHADPLLLSSFSLDTDGIVADRSLLQAGQGAVGGDEAMLSGYPFFSFVWSGFISRYAVHWFAIHLIVKCSDIFIHYTGAGVAY